MTPGRGAAHWPGHHPALFHKWEQDFYGVKSIEICTADGFIIININFPYNQAIPILVCMYGRQ